MAAIPPISTSPVQTPAPADRLADARAAFFRQALTTTAGPQILASPAAQAVRATPPAAAPAPARPATMIAQAPQPDPDRPLRPGSIINIRV